MNVIVEGIVIESNNVDPQSIQNICNPIIVRPEVRITWVREEHRQNV
jgi:hypothetical protein